MILGLMPPPAERERTRPPPFRLLQVFAALARLGSVRMAAAALDCAPERVRRRLAELELDLKAPLARIEGDAARLTETGAALYAAIAPELAQIERGWRELTLAAPTPLVVAASPITMSLWLAPRLAAWSAARPDVEVRTVTRGSAQGFGRDGEDVVFTPAPFSKDPREVAHIVSSWNVCLGAHPVDLDADLPEEARLLDPARGPANRSIWDLWFKARGRERGPGQVIVPTDDLLIRQRAILGQGLTMLGITAAKDDLAAGRLHLQHRFAFRFRYYLRWRPEISASPTLHAFREYLREEGRAQEAEEEKLLARYGCVTEPRRGA